MNLLKNNQTKKEEGIMQFTHRKCMVCDSTTEDMGQSQCSCGAYMYMIAPFYSPKRSVEHSEKIKTAPITLASFGAV